VVAAVVRHALVAVRDAAPDGVEVREIGERLGDVEFLVPGFDAMPDLAAMPALRVVQLLSAGSETAEPLIPPGVTLCNARGARDTPVAEWVVGALLGAASGLLVSARDRVWDHTPPAELGAWTVVIVGHGSIGEAVRARLEPFGTRVVGVARRAREGVKGLDALPRLLPRADAVVVLVPLTGASRGMVDAAFLAAMPDGAVLVNAGRGAVVDTAALLAEVRAPRLRAVLDVTDPEPLPAGHELWSAPGVLAITPHQSGDSAEADRRAARLAGEQLGRYARGEPLHNVVIPGAR
jgi:phosphoglycerate dehydrogenase-like enzyme